jgi:MoxR-like ATPase
VAIVKSTTTDNNIELQKIMGADDILYFQQLVRRVPVPDNVLEYAVKLVHKTRPNAQGSEVAKNYIAWGAGPRASQNLILGAKCHALLHGKFSPDIENVKAIANNVLRHRVVRNYKAEAEGLKIEDLIERML